MRNNKNQSKGITSFGAIKLRRDITNIVGAATLTVFSAPFLYAQENSAIQKKEEPTNSASVVSVEEIVVTGTRKSWEDSADIKRRASQIVDAIVAEDVGKLPDDNVAEAMQRITGIQIDRNSEGEGSSFQVRGLSDNRVELDGQSLVSDSQDNRSVSFDNLPSSLFKSIEVIKSPSASDIEGAIGATVRLKTFKPLDHKKPKTEIIVEGSGEEIAQDLGVGHRITGIHSRQFHFDDFSVGVLGNISTTQKYDVNELATVDWKVVKDKMFNHVDGAKEGPYEEGGFPGAGSFKTYLPAFMENSRRETETEIHAANMNFQMIFGENFDAFMNFTLNNTTRQYNQTRGKVRTEKDDHLTIYDENFLASDGAHGTGRNFDTAGFRDNLGLDVDSELYNFQLFSRQSGGGASPDYFLEDGTLYEGDVTRGIIDRGVFYFWDHNSNENRAGNVFRTLSSSTARDNLNKAGTTFRINSEGFEEIKKTTSFSTGFDWLISSDVSLSAKYAYVNAEREENKIFTNFDASYIREGENEGEYDLITPDVYFNFSSGNDLPTYNLDWTEFNRQRTADGLSGDTKNTLSRDVYRWNQLGGNRKFFETGEQALQFDLDWEVDRFGFESIESGIRIAERSFSRRNQKVAISDTLQGPSIGLHSIFGIHRDAMNGADEYGLDPLENPDIAPNDFDSINAHPQTVFDVNQLFKVSADNILYDGVSGDVPRNWVQVGQLDPTFWFNNLNRIFPGSADGSIESASLRENRGFSYDIAELVSAAYAQFNFAGEYIFPYAGNFGVRVAHTEISAENAPSYIIGVGGADILAQTGTVSGYVRGTASKEKVQYTNILPSMNVTVEFMPELLGRLALYRGISRPAPNRVASTVTGLNVDFNPEANGVRTYEVGNPYLRPKVSDAADFTLEYYHSKSSYVSFGAFYKDISQQDVRIDIRDVLQFDHDGDGELSLFPESENKDNTPRIRTRINDLSDRSLYGFELAGQMTFDMLPSPYDGIGVSANYTKTVTKLSNEFSDLTGAAIDIDGLSPNSYNLVLFYEKYGFNIRAAYNYRDTSPRGLMNRSTSDEPGYVGTPLYQNIDGTLFPVSTGLNVEQKGFGQLDLSLNYNFNKRYRLSFQAKDLLEQPRIRHIYGQPELVTRWERGSTFYKLGLRVKF